MKKAYIVDVTLSTRVVVDLPDELANHNGEQHLVEKEEELVCQAGLDRIKEIYFNDPDSVGLDHVTDWMPDEEIPYVPGEEG
jgi:hypothetical protein